MNTKNLYRLGKAIFGDYTPKQKQVIQPQAFKVNNHFKTRKSLKNLTFAENIACETFSKFYSKVDGAIKVKEESLSLINYANVLRTLYLKIERDPAPIQLISALWRKMSISPTVKTYKSECIKFETYRYSPNYDYEKVLIFAGLMVVVKESYPNEDNIDEIIKTIRTCASSKDNQAYFAPFDEIIHTFTPDEVTISLTDIIKQIKSASKPYKAQAMYDMLLNIFSQNESAIGYIKSECADIKMSEPEIGTHIDNVHVNDGGSMNMMDNCSIQKDNKPLLTDNIQNQLEYEN